MTKSLALDKKAAKQMIEKTSEMLADTYILYLKTQNFHWNLVDPRFHPLHLFFESQYEELAEAVDLLAERIRQLGGKTPATMKEFLSLASLKEANPKHDYSGDEMLQELCKDHATIVDKFRPLVDLGTKLEDHGTADLYIERMRAHDKAGWMLRSHFTR